jgi:hypothetical protein
MSTLAVHVTHVVRLGTQEQMVGVYAATIIAAVQNEQTVFDRPVCKFIRKTMGGYLLCVVAQTPVTVVPTTASPGPAAVGLFSVSFAKPVG